MRRARAMTGVTPSGGDRAHGAQLSDFVGRRVEGP